MWLAKPKAMFNSILMVDDSDVDLFITSKIIEMSQVCAHTVAMNSPLRALDYLRSSAEADRDTPDLLLLDVNMPYMNGFEFLAQLERALPEQRRPRVVLLTSSVDDRDRAKAAAFWSVLGFINKPLTVEALQQLQVHALRPSVGLAA